MVKDIALGVNEPVPQGPPRSLIRFGELVNAIIYRNWEGEFGEIGKGKDGESFQDVFNRITNHVVDLGGRIKFDITNFDFDRAALDFGKELKDADSYTGWELHQIMNNSKLLNSTDFYDNGGIVPKSEVINRYNQSINNGQK